MAQKTFRSGRPLARLSITMFVHLNWDSCVSSHMWWGGLSPGGKNERVNEDVMILTQSALLVPYARNPLVANGLHSQMSGNDFCVVRSSKMLNKQASGRWFETSSCWCIEEDFLIIGCTERCQNDKEKWREWSKFTPHFTRHVITYLVLGLQLNNISKIGHWSTA